MNIKARIVQWQANLTVKRRMTQKLAELNYDFNTFSIELFTQMIAVRRKREIFFIAGPLPPEMSGCWVSIADSPREYVLYGCDLHPLLQIHTQLHELSHILCEHPTLNLTLDELRLLIRQGRLDVLLQNALQRSLTTNEMEQEAETLAALIQLQAIRHARLAELTTVPQNPRTDTFLRDVGAV